MLSVINWTNRNNFSGATDNRFDDVFGALANQAVAVVDATIAQWQRVISSFNYGGGPDTYNVSVTMAAAPLTTGSGVGAGTSVFGFTNGKPSSASITINYRAIANSGNTSSGWWLDPTPTDNSEFIGLNANTSAWVGIPTTPLGGGDLFTGILHELGHAMGLSSNPAINAFVTDTGVVDNVNAPASVPASDLWRFDSPNVHTLWTAWNSTGGTGQPGSNRNGAQHSAPAGIVPIVQNNRTYYGFTDLMNASFTSRSIITDTHALMLQDAYGYTITNPLTFGTFYDRLDVNGSLNITTPEGGPDTVKLEVIGSNLFVSMTLGSPIPGPDPTSFTSIFPLVTVKSINIATGSGSDRVIISPISDSIPINVNLGESLDGNDVLEVHGTSGYDSMTATAYSITSSGVKIAMSGAESITLSPDFGYADIYLGIAFGPVMIEGLGGDDTIVLHSVSAFASVVINGNGGNDTITIAPDGGFHDINGAVTIYGGSGADTINLAPIGFGAASIDAPITIFGGTENDTLNLTGGNLDALTRLVTFDGETGTMDKIVLNDQVPNGSYSYDITNTSVTRNPLFVGLNYSNTDRIVLNCGPGANTVRVANSVGPILEIYGNDGSDNFIVGAGLVGAQPGHIFNGGSGNDTITFDDHLRANNVIWDLRPNEVLYGGLLSLNTAGFESVGVLAGTGNDEITFDGVLLQNFDVDAGGGNDTVKFGFLVKAELAGSVSVTGGTGNDNFLWNRGSNNWSNYGYLSGPFANNIALDGGSGYNTLSVDDASRGIARYDLSENRLRATESTFLVFGSDFSYDNMAAIGIACSNSDNVVVVTGVSTDIDAGNQVTILMNGGTDSAFIYPHDAQGNLTINGNLGIGGGTGSDSLTINDTASSLPIDYVFRNPFGAGTTSIAGLGAGGFGAGSDFESITIDAGTGDDTFVIEKYLGVIPLTINAGAGNDAFDVTPTAKNLAANMAAANSLAFYGGEGYDSIGLHNDNNNNGNLYTVYGTQLNVSNLLGAPSFAASIQHTSVEYTTVTAGPKSDIFWVLNTVPGTVYDLDAGSGAVDDSFSIGSPLAPQVLSGIHGGVYVNGAGGGFDTVTLYDNTDSTGRTVHVGNDFVGATPGDDIFGAGGYLHYAGIAGTMTINLGTGADTVYAAPNPSTPLVINGNGPAAAGSGSQDGGSGSGLIDFLGLAFANAANPVLAPGGAGAGSYTFDNAAPLTYSGMESTEIDDVAPYILDQGYDDTGAVPMIFVQFSEDVSAAFTVDYLELIDNTTMEQVPSALLDVTYDAGTNTASFTFPGYTDGILPAGDYTAKILGTLTDLAGNPLGVETPFDFTVIDAIAPYILDQGYDDTGAVPMIFVQFSEDVSAALTVEYLELMNNTTTAQVPFAYLDLTYDTDTNTARFTFPGYTDGILPAGDYTAKILGTLTDLAGNPLDVETPFDFTVIDAIAPYILDQGYDDTGAVPTIFVQFSEDVSAALTVDYLELIDNTTMEQVPSALLDVTYDAGTNTASFTFPGYTDSILPAGDYTAKILGTLTDLAGNPLGAETPFDFTVAAVYLDADVNMDGFVNIFDINLVSANWGTAGPAGDANHDNIVNIFDINLVSAFWGQFPPGGAGTGGSTANNDSVDADSAAENSTLRVASSVVEPVAIEAEVAGGSIAARAAATAVAANFVSASDVASEPILNSHGLSYARNRIASIAPSPMTNHPGHRSVVPSRDAFHVQVGEIHLLGRSVPRTLAVTRKATDAAFGNAQYETPWARGGDDELITLLAATDEAPNQLTVRAEVTGLPNVPALLKMLGSQIPAATAKESRGQ
jgi:hypothetical protein